MVENKWIQFPLHFMFVFLGFHISLYSVIRLADLFCLLAKSVPNRNWLDSTLSKCCAWLQPQKSLAGEEGRESCLAWDGSLCGHQQPSYVWQFGEKEMRANAVLGFTCCSSCISALSFATAFRLAVIWSLMCATVLWRFDAYWAASANLWLV